MSTLKHKRFIKSCSPGRKRKQSDIGVVNDGKGDSEGSVTTLATCQNINSPSSSALSFPLARTVSSSAMVRRVRFGGCIDINKSYQLNVSDAEMLKECRNDIWYTRKDYETFLKDRIDTVRVWRSVNGDTVGLETQYCFRGLEAYQSKALSMELADFRNQHIVSVLQKQDQQAKGIKHTKALNPKSIARKVAILSKRAAERARQLATLDEAEAVQIYQPDHHLSKAGHFTPPRSPSSITVDLYAEKQIALNRKLFQQLAGEEQSSSPHGHHRPQKRTSIPSIEGLQKRHDPVAAKEEVIIQQRRDSMVLARRRREQVMQHRHNSITALVKHRQQIQQQHHHLLALQQRRDSLISQQRRNTMSQTHCRQRRRTSILGEEVQKRRNSMVLQEKIIRQQQLLLQQQHGTFQCHTSIPDNFERHMVFCDQLLQESRRDSLSQGLHHNLGRRDSLSLGVSTHRGQHNCRSEDSSPPSKRPKSMTEQEEAGLSQQYPVYDDHISSFSRIRRDSLAGCYAHYDWYNMSNHHLHGPSEAVEKIQK